ncbi:hypothetical protein [Streptomyces roseolilacinus]
MDFDELPDAARRPPGGVPPALRERAARVGLASWAGFTYLGR